LRRDVLSMSKKMGSKEMRFAGIVAVFLAAMMFIGNAMALPAGKKEYAGGPMGKVVFDAKMHADKKQLCPACHVKPKLWEQKPGANTTKMTMAAMNEGKFCGACHDGKKAFSVKAPADCAKCHKK
jgi:c(7)-type cytochrome triheme protein